MKRELPERGQQRSQVKQITKRHCLPRTLMVRFRHQLHLRLTLLLRLTLPVRLTLLLRLITCFQHPERERTPMGLLLQRHRPPRRLESLTRDSILPRPLWLLWLSHRAGKALLFT
jgi:hypothetical protein